MGYRSDVAIEMEDKAYGLMRRALLGLRKKHGEDWAIPEITRDEGTYYLKWEGVKWYDGFYDVDAVEGVLKELREKHPDEDGYSYYKIRIGEDSDDIEEESNNTNYYPCIYVERYVEGAGGEKVEL